MASVFAPMLPLSSRAAELGSFPRLAGLNIACGEFGKVPGRFGKDYIYPERGSLAACARLGFNSFRLPFRWERIQPRLGDRLVDTEAARIKGVVAEAADLGLNVVLDMHNYAARVLEDDDWQQSHIIGSSTVPAAAFSDVWGKLAEVFRDDRHVSFGIMNEPHGLPVEQWLQAANLALTAIRNAGARNLVMVPGVAYTGAHSWIKAGNAAMGEARDPIGNMVIEVHQYLDADSSGSKPETVSPTIGSERLLVFESWARSKRVKAYLGEFAAADTDIGRAALDDMLGHLLANRDVWIGWAAWAAGPWWPQDYFFRLEPRADGTVPQTLVTLSNRAGQFVT